MLPPARLTTVLNTRGGNLRRGLTSCQATSSPRHSKRRPFRNRPPCCCSARALPALGRGGGGGGERDQSGDLSAGLGRGGCSCRRLIPGWQAILSQRGEQLFLVPIDERVTLGKEVVDDLPAACFQP